MERSLRDAFYCQRWHLDSFCQDSLITEFVLFPKKLLPNCLGITIWIVIGFCLRIALYISSIPWLRFVMSYIMMTQFTKSKTRAPSREYKRVQCTKYTLFPAVLNKPELDMLLGSRLIVWCKAREQKVVFLASCWGAESTTVLNWRSDQSGIWAEGPAAPSNASILGTPGCCTCLSWLTTSPFDPSHEPWQVPRWSRRKHKHKVHTLTTWLVCWSTHTYSHSWV